VSAEAAGRAHGDPVVTVRDLEIGFGAGSGFVPAVRGLSFDVDAGETLGIVGESGSGKTLTALALIGLLPAGAVLARGSIAVDGIAVDGARPRALRTLRGRHVGMVFQDSMTSLNPVLSIGLQIAEVLRYHRHLDRHAARRRAAELLDEMGVPAPERRLRQYPHQLSGGLRQRVAIAMALAADPAVLIADEPTTALDVTVQSQLLDLLLAEQRRRGMALVLITHDLGVVARICDRIAVMYAGRVVESGTAETVFAARAHPYTRGLFDSIPQADAPVRSRLRQIPGTPPAIWAIPTGCAFHPRCPIAGSRCARAMPLLEPQAHDASHLSACWAPETD
jgi:peptide/nickel transport system ATP-binding protein